MIKMNGKELRALGIKSKYRYIIKIGRFGCYFYDTELKQEVNLASVLFLLNENVE